MTIKSWNKKLNKDCFGNGNPKTIDHVWPISKGGSNAKINQQLLSFISNSEKADKTKGKVRGQRFSVRREVDKNGSVYGVMLIKKGNGWIEVEKVL